MGSKGAHDGCRNRNIVAIVTPLCGECDRPLLSQHPLLALVESLGFSCSSPMVSCGGYCFLAYFSSFDPLLSFFRELT